MPVTDPGGNFNDKQQLKLDTATGNVYVDTKGPLSDYADLKEICVWVFQRKPGQPNDIAATEMSTTMKDRGEFTQAPSVGSPNRKWGLPARKLADGSGRQLEAGPAIAMAIAFFENHNSPDPNQFKVVQWAQSVELLAPEPPTSG